MRIEIIFAPMKQSFLIIIFSIFHFVGISQSSDDADAASRFIGFEYGIGSIAKNYSDFPDLEPRQTIGILRGKDYHHKGYALDRFYHHPKTSLGFYVSRLGHDELFGYEFRLQSAIDIGLDKHWDKLFLRIGAGGSYYTKKFEGNMEFTNRAVGSKLMWAIQGQLYWRKVFSNDQVLRIGLAFDHGSNGHAQLPNFGLNSYSLKIGMDFRTRTFSVNELGATAPDLDPKANRWQVLKVRTGWGIHEFGGTAGPVGNAKKPVYTLAISQSIRSRRNYNINIGMAVRYYGHYYDFITTHPDELEFIEEPILNSSNLYLFSEAEFYFGHLGAYFEVGANVFKPFYSRFYDIFEFGNNSPTDKFLKSAINNRAGFNIYRHSLEKGPKFNYFIGAGVSTNFGQADFTEINVGIMKYWE